MDEISTQWLTLLVLVGFAVAIPSVDVWLARTHGVGATFSRVSAMIFEHCPILYPVVVFALGVLVGHIGLPQYIRPR